jgi:hypothetical protein
MCGGMNAVSQLGVFTGERLPLVLQYGLRKTPDRADGILEVMDDPLDEPLANSLEITRLCPSRSAKRARWTRWPKKRATTNRNGIRIK